MDNPINRKLIDGEVYESTGLLLCSADHPNGWPGYSFTERYGAECSIQASSLATEAAIWFGIDDPWPQSLVPGQGWKDWPREPPFPSVKSTICSGRMHLTQDQVKRLLPVLQYFADHGCMPVGFADVPSPPKEGD